MIGIDGDAPSLDTLLPEWWRHTLRRTPEGEREVHSQTLNRLLTIVGLATSLARFAVHARRNMFDHYGCLYFVAVLAAWASAARMLNAAID
jgi:hypothetical protein